jgi:hypothetical protein
MDRKLWSLLKESGISDSSCSVLFNEDVSTAETFAWLEKEHLTKLAPKLTLGQHALLLKVWRSQSGMLQGSS